MNELRSAKVGDTIVHPDGREVIVRYNANDYLFATGRDGSSIAVVDHRRPSSWRLKPTFPEWWINVYEHSCGQPNLTRMEANIQASKRRIGVIHLAKDGTLTMERP